MKITTILLRIVQFVVLTVLFAVIYMRSSMSLVSYMPPMSLAEPGPIPSPLDFLLVSAVQALVIMTILLSSSKHGWKLALVTGFAYYGVTTFMAQIEVLVFFVGSDTSTRTASEDICCRSGNCFYLCSISSSCFMESTQTRCRKC